MSNNGLLSPFVKQPIVTDRFGDMRRLPPISQNGSVTLGANSGVGINITSAITIPMGLPIGFTTMIYNDSASAITITAATGTTARISAATTTKTSFSLFPYGLCSVWSNRLNNLILSGDIV